MLDLLRALRSRSRVARRQSLLRRRRPARGHDSDRLLFESLEPRLVLDGGPLLISEFMADNGTGLTDVDGHYEDWIEIHNPAAPASDPVSLDGWYLTDDSAVLTKWQFPDVSLGGGEHLVVFASDKNRTDPAGELHTNFRLNRNEEGDANKDFLALVMPGGTFSDISHSFAPWYPEQLEDISYGISGTVTTGDVLVDASGALRVLVPTDDSLDATWFLPGFNDSGWTAGDGGVGYATEPASPLDGLIETDVEGDMFGSRTSAYVRSSFVVAEPDQYIGLTLDVRYDDGFVAYLNGTEIASRNAPVSPAFDSPATADRPIEQATLGESIDVTVHKHLLAAGDNVLAIHGLNDDASSADFLIVAELTAQRTLPENEQYFSVPTPGNANIAGALGTVADTTFSVDHGFFEAPQQVIIDTATAGAEIRYTTDGSVPTATYGTVYTAPVPISSTTTLRAAAFKPGYIATNVDTQTYIFLHDVITQDGVGMPDNWGHDGADYAMDPDVVQDPLYSDTIKDDLKSLPTLSLVMPQDDWFGGGGQGIYIQGKGIERAVSAELIHPDGRGGFQIDSAVEIQGGTSTNRWKVDKLSMQLTFKRPYGPTKLVHDLFDDSPVDEFDTLIVDAMMNLSWLHPWQDQRVAAQYVRDQYVADLQNEMGGNAPHGRYVNLYLNGMYWGLYWLHERSDESFASSYLGGDKEDYDVIKHTSGTIVNGDNVHYNQMFAVANAGLASDPQYELIQDYLDVPSFIDYMIVNFYAGNTDWAHHNWYATRHRSPEGRWRYHSWDAEHVLKGLNDNVTGRDNNGGPTRLHQKLLENDEYKLLFADHVHRHFFNDGLLAPDNAKAMYQTRIDQVDRAVVGESARWGDNQRASDPYTRDDEWVTQRDWLLNSYFPQRSDIVFNQLAADGLYPSVDAPVLNQHGGEVPRGFEVDLTAPVGEIYYTIDGSDPRSSDNTVSPTAILHDEVPFAIQDNTTVKARVRDGDGWSALAEAEFYVSSASAASLTLTEINYHPYGTTPVEAGLGYDEDDFEFVELLNTSTDTINLGGVRFSDGIDFDFSSGSVPQLAPGERVVVVSNLSAFEARYGTSINVAGQYDDLLDNGGERVVLLDRFGGTIADFRYDDASNWPGRADGRGSSLEVIDLAGDLSDDDAWRSSHDYGGSPGVAGTEPYDDVVINEVLTHPTGVGGDTVDFVELYNTTDVAIDISGWYLSDSSDNYQKYQVSDADPRSTLPSGEFVLFDEAELGFAFDQNSPGDVWLLEGSAEKPIRFADHAEFGTAATAGLPFGLWPDGREPFVTLRSATPRAANDGPEFLPLVITEFMASNDDTLLDGDGNSSDWIEVHNPTEFAADLTGWYLTDDENLLTKWQFPSGNLEPGGYLVVFASGGRENVVDPVDPFIDPQGNLHTNFNLSAGGEYLALVQPDRFTVSHEYKPEYPSQPGDISYGLVQEVTTLVETGAGLSYVVPADDSLGTNWTATGFDDSGWTDEIAGGEPAVTGIGFNTRPDGLNVTYYKANVSVGDVATAEQVIADPAKQSNVVFETAEYINYYNTGGIGNYGNDIPFPTQTIGTDVDDFVIEATGTVVIPQAGAWTFGVNSDDGFSFDLSNGTDDFSMSYPNPRGPADTLQTFILSQAGAYSFRLVYFERGGGSGLELFAAQGTHSSFDAGAFDLIGDTANGGLAVTGFGGVIGTDVQADMHGVNASIYTRIPFNVDDPADFESLALRMQYNDGFVAYLNGHEIARRNAPALPEWNSVATAERDASASKVFEEINVSQSLGQLRAGTNVLAIHGLNRSAGDDEFLILPELVGTKGTLIQQYFGIPTPGGQNDTGYLDLVKDTRFSVDRGFYDQAFDVVITTDTSGATIVYTTDGSEPTLTNGTAVVPAGPDDPSQATVNVTTTTVLRAAAFKTGWQPADVDTQTYIFLDDVIQQPSAPAGFPDIWKTEPADYEMDPDVTTDPAYSGLFRSSLLSLPTMSLVIDADDLFDANTGIYANPTAQGVSWERPASLEYFDPAGTSEFQIDAGVRMYGGVGRSSQFKKHSFRFLFKDIYGASKLDYPLFGDDAVDQFDTIILRSNFNDAWVWGGAPTQFVRDELAGQLQIAMGEPGRHGTFVHLYVNGLYWGLYNPVERPDPAFSSSYMGGEKEQWDGINSNAPVSGGTRTEWDALMDLADAGLDSNENYQKVQGNNPDGTNNPAYEDYLDIDNYITYLLMNFWAGNNDWVSHNWYAGRVRGPDSTGWKAYSWDAEWIVDMRSGLTDNTVNDGDNVTGDYLLKPFSTLRLNEDFQRRFADQVHEHMFNDGVLTPDKLVARYQALSGKVEAAVISESARWGDVARTDPYGMTEWSNERDYILNTYLPQRTNIVLGQLRAANLYPDVDAATYNQHGGQVDEGFQLTMAAPAGMIYYTDDGTDPRLPDGNVSPNARWFNPGTTTNALVSKGANWKYLDNGSDQGTAWRGTGFNDSSWATGDAQLGYGDNDDEVTVLGYGPDSSNKYTTTYFRHEFSVTDVADITSLTLGLLRDDGAIVYLNGQEIVRSNMPSGIVGYQTFAAANVAGVDEDTYYEYAVDPSLLVEGQNLLAVELHQISLTSVDISFDLELTATKSTGPPTEILLADTTTYNARVLSGGEWSALNKATFYVGDTASSANLAVAEINYNPYVPTEDELAVDPGLNNDSFEFVELVNYGTRRVELTDVTFTAGIDFTFPYGSYVEPGERVVLVSDPAAFELRYGTGIAVAGQYTGLLDNGGEDIALENRLGEIVQQFSFDDEAGWPGRADGRGSTLELINSASSHGDDGNWRSSSEYGGTPGAAGAGPVVDVVVNEVLSQPGATELDAIELYNTTGVAIDIGGWFLSDSNGNYQKYKIPADDPQGRDVIPAGGYAVFDESDFNRSGGPNDFALNGAGGEDVWLLEADSTGKLLRFVDHVEFGGALPGVSLGRWPNGGGDGNLVLMSQVTLDAENAPPLVSTVVINEIHADPDVKTEPVEYVELYNAGTEAVDLTGWSLTGGVSFTFPDTTQIDGGEYLIVSQDPAAVQAKFGVSSLGPFTGKLANEGDRVVLRSVGGIVQDEVEYGLGFPWPTFGEPPGYSLELINPAFDNDLGGNWKLSVGRPVSEEVLFEVEQRWNYFKGTAEPSATQGEWRQIDFDDGTWLNGDAAIGYGEDFLATELTDMQGGYSTVYFRKEFNVPDASVLNQLLLELQYDDGINVWMNGTHVVGVNVSGDELPFNATAESTIENVNLVPFTLLDPQQYLVTGINVIAVQLLNASLSGSGDAFFDARLVGVSGGDAGATPGARNSVLSTNAAPQMRQIEHSPNQPTTGQEVTVTIKVTDPDRVDTVTLEYQAVDPGDYIALDDPRYQTDWTAVAMYDDGTHGDQQSGDDVYTAVLPGSLQAHRRLVRYRVTAQDGLGVSNTAPYSDDPQPNFAYFVYDAVPSWTGSAQPGVEPEVEYSSELLDSVPVYQLITTRTAHEQSQFIPDSTASRYNGSEYQWQGTLVYDGVVYDHIHYRARGGVWRYAMGKNMWKFDFNRGHSFQARDDYGNLYETTWDKLNFSALIQQGNFLQRGEQGLFEAVGFKLHDLAGNAAPKTHYVQFRVIEDADEDGADQFSGDFQGLYLVVEQPDGNFLDEHGLPDGNLYKMESGTGTLNNQGATQPTDKSDLNAFTDAYKNNPTQQWWEENVDLEDYYTFRAIAMAVHDYDIHAGKNYFYYHNPETGKWTVLNWDLDLTWTTTYNGGGGGGPLNQYVFDIPQFKTDYNSRVRELTDLLFNPEQTGMMIDEMASFVYTPGQPSLVDADAAMWDYNPILTSGYVNSSKAGHGRFYESSPTDDFAGMVQKLEDYVANRMNSIDPLVASDENQQPDTPTISYVGAAGHPVDGLNFQSSGFSGGSGTFAAMEWRIAEVTDPNDPGFDLSQPRQYEMTATWESDELTTFNSAMTVPGYDVTPGKTYRVRVRMKDDAGRWSHWSDPEQFVAGVATGPLADGLRITEIMYRPPAPTAAELAVNPQFVPDDFEFVELQNTTGQTLDLTGVVFVDGIEFDFSGSANTSLAPGDLVVIVGNEAAFEARYGTAIAVAGEFSGTLDDLGENIEVIDPYERTVHDFLYDNSGDWPDRAEGQGSSLEIVDTTSDYDDASSWRSSAEYGGSPGYIGSGATTTVVINEVQSHTDDPLTDAIELYNAGDTTQNIAGWWLSDSSSDYHKFEIPVLDLGGAGRTELAPGDYVVFYEGHWVGPAGNRQLLFDQTTEFGGTGEDDFALNAAHGDEVWLVATDAQGNPTRFVDYVEFGAAANGESFGRWPNELGTLYPMTDWTPTTANSGPRIGPLVISEIMYHPTAPTPADLAIYAGLTRDDLEYIEIYNGSPLEVPLENWRIREGIDFDFAQSATIESGETLVILSFDPDATDGKGERVNEERTAAVRNHYGIDTSVTLIGAYFGRLADGGEWVQLQRPDEPPAEEPLFIPRLLEDETTYDDVFPWPIEADGYGMSLTRYLPAGWGNDAISWSGANPTPGDIDTSLTRPPTLAAIADPAPILEDAGLQQIDLTGIAAGWGENQPLSVSATSDNPSLIPHPTVTYATPDSTGTLAYTPAPRRNGTARITVTVTDGGFDANLNTPGDNRTFAQTFTVTVLFTSLKVASFAHNASGFALQLNHPVNRSVLNLYDIEAGTFGQSDVTLVGDSVGTIEGSLAVHSHYLEFLAASGPLPADHYTLTLRSAVDAFKDLGSGELLDGNGDLIAGDDYVAEFDVSAPHSVVLSLPDFSRGPGQQVNVPADASGLPLRLSEGDGVESVDLTIEYDPDLLNVTGAVLGNDAPAGSSIVTDTTTPGVVSLNFTAGTPLPSGVAEFVTLIADVPSAATYGDAHVLHVASLSVNGGAIDATADDAIHLATRLGDTTGNGDYSGLDAQRVARVTVGLDAGFQTCPTIHPLVVADVTGNGSLSALDAQRIAMAAVGLDPPEIPFAGDFLRARREAGASDQPPATPVLTDAQLTPIVAAAVQHMESVQPDTAASLDRVRFEIVDLPGDALGRAFGETIQIDINAAGLGWFVDTTPFDDSEFVAFNPLVSPSPTLPVSSSSADARTDLLTAVLHEMGHVLGREHEDGGFMDETLAPGTRRLPIQNAIDKAFAFFDESP